MLKRPCAKCPFRTDVPAYLTPGRVTELEQAVRAQQDFYCHATIDYSGTEETGEGRVTQASQRCAGFTILCEKIGRPTQMMRIEERLGYYDARQIDMAAPVFDSFAAMRKAQRERRKRPATTEATP